MGLKAWISKKLIAGIVHAVCINYDQIRRQHPELSEAEISQQAVRDRFRVIKLFPHQKLMFDMLIHTVKTLKGACVFVAYLEQESSNGYPLAEGEAEEIIISILKTKGRSCT